MKLRVKLIVFIAAMCAWAIGTVLMRGSLRVQTDITSLVNMENESGFPVQNITDKFSSVINIVVRSSNRISGEMTARKIRDVINSDKFPELNLWVNDLSPRGFVKAFGKYHNVMIGGTDRKLLQENKFQDITENVGRRIESSMMPNLLPLSEDPFLLFTNYVSELGFSGGNWIPQNGVLWQYRAPYNFYMLPTGVNIKDSAALVKTVARLKSAIADFKTQGIDIYMGGAPLHTAEMYRRSKIEIGVISILALLAAVLLNYMLFRRISTLVPIGISLIVGYLAGTIALFLCFGVVHILVFVFGTTLIGLGIDYGFHFMCIANGEDRRVVHKSILHSLITTIACFAPLLFASIDLLRQISVFTIIGLGMIYLFIKWFASNKKVYIPKKFKTVRPIRMKYRVGIIGGIMLVTIVVCAFAHIENNMAAMYRPKGELLTAEKIIGDLNQSSGAFLIVRGQTTQDVLETEETLRDSGMKFFGVSSMIPSLRRQAENNQMVKELYKSQARNIKKALGLGWVPQFTPAQPINYENPDIGALTNQIEKFLLKTADGVYSVSSVSSDTVVQNENAVVIAPAQQIQKQMEKFSTETYRLLVICGMLLIVGLVFLYGRDAFKYIMPPLMGVGVSVAFVTILGLPMTVFHLLGLFIVIGLGLDYAIFHIRMRQDTELRPVFYSFLTSFIGFGLLAFTSFFLVAALGMIIAIGIGVAYLTSLYLFRN